MKFIYAISILNELTIIMMILNYMLIQIKGLCDGLSHPVF